MTMSASKSTASPLIPEELGLGASMMEKNTAAAVSAFITAVSGTEMEEMWASIVMIDMRTLE